MRGILQPGAWWAVAYQLAALATFVRLTWFDGYTYTATNWAVAVPVNLLLAEVWPVYWTIIRPLFAA